MNKQKLSYLSPETETLVVRFEGVVCTSPLVNVAMSSSFMPSFIEDAEEDW